MLGVSDELNGKPKPVVEMLATVSFTCVQCRSSVLATARTSNKTDISCQGCGAVYEVNLNIKKGLAIWNKGK